MTGRRYSIESGGEDVDIVVKYREEGWNWIWDCCGRVDSSFSTTLNTQQKVSYKGPDTVWKCRAKGK